ncbi:DNA polymerase III subunit gamma/tau [Aquisalinus flavus]|uniref:DNA polymerase III subunit gamma/tau n=1 Tax=Aquisalinus flavus TaxID=1526572 RepID=A0A8J2Y5D8_9PROT|nr:DNA polymerase III subunit gamma/tau [Aquisalinus flavus]MBD0425939.1 DNA polymerase III subunit gamma/tau [Aquisalinus flavus]UNE48467.1 DNA polymerase III subunit gamma/tau [Aquisalinus flavus]GGD12032.1 DNA polymerase III subunit gamma/tau [Aquisalinus flavus]
MSDTETPKPAEGQKPPYQVLARKYRPQNFEDLLGHDAMVRTLRNAFASGRIAHAWILTGVRGVGKTTTARIMARALNYETEDGIDVPTIDMDRQGIHCQAIAESRHPDVIEMDAASRTGVGDIRELIESVRYAPVQARYKVYIIDEVHMLSNSAFNALLKTLEEPPPHVKFIFATTEIRKLPVTVLSRCQRFDLRRFDQDTLADYLQGICEKENAVVERDGLLMIARAAEGSVRDALSLLDQAIIQHATSGGETVTAGDVQDMLGLADRATSWEMLDAAMTGDAAEALRLFRRQYDAGADPVVILRDMLELVHLLTRVKAAGDEAASHGSAGTAEAAQAKGMAERFPMAGLTRAWSLLMKGLQETQVAPDPAAAGEMTLIRLCYAADLPTPDEAVRMLTEGKVSGGAAPAGPGAGMQGASANGGGNSGGGARAVSGGAMRQDPQPSGAPKAGLRSQPKLEAANQTRLSSLKDLVALCSQNRDARLRHEIENFVRIVKFEPGVIDFHPADGAPRNLAGRIAAKLKDWTGERWTVSINTRETGEDTLRHDRDSVVYAHPLFIAAREAFPEIPDENVRIKAIAEVRGEHVEGADGALDEEE